MSFPTSLVHPYERCLRWCICLVHLRPLAMLLPVSLRSIRMPPILAGQMAYLLGSCYVRPRSAVPLTLAVHSAEWVITRVLVQTQQSPCEHFRILPAHALVLL